MDLLSYLETALAVVGAAAVIVAGLEKVAAITPTTKDDKYVGVAKKALGYVSYWLDVISMGLPAHKARKD